MPPPQLHFVFGGGQGDPIDFNGGGPNLMPFLHPPPSFLLHFGVGGGGTGTPPPPNSMECPMGGGAQSPIGFIGGGDTGNLSPPPNIMGVQ